jgi:integrase
LSPVKNHQSRTVPIPAIVSEELTDYKTQCNPDGLVFPSVTGTPLRNRNWRRDVFDSAVAALRLKITPHNLRDTAASLAIQEGASVVAIARLLGHESAATTLALNHYAGLFPTDLDDIASRLNVAALLTIAGQRESSGAKQSPTKHRPNEAKVNKRYP